jgi:hypothetical protein
MNGGIFVSEQEEILLHKTSSKSPNIAKEAFLYPR